VTKLKVPMLPLRMGIGLSASGAWAFACSNDKNKKQAQTAQDKAVHRRGTNRVFWPICRKKQLH